ncbi:Kinase suppressor of Ras 1 [Armadillidium nasatum]|uniref:Kinase suppressor of Ras 1 n=1 Tax=Armadillidium nasatum TaxID=96803 RepID=A0A5N5SIQ3_9CRUS|nr:Kinase suppressor of Ras 1 [Armadillidium nasatum]
MHPSYMPSTHIFRRRRFARPFQWGSMDQLTPRRTRLQSDSGAETVMSSDVSRSPDSGVFYGDLRDGRNMGSCDFMDDSNKVGYQNSPLSSKLTSPTKIQYHMENDDGYSSKNTLNVPKFARPIMNLSGSMGHNVHHRFSIALKPDKCGYCHQKFQFLGGLKCKECNFKCHKECEPKIAPSCGLPRELLEIFTESYNRDLEQQSGKIGSSAIHGYSQLNDSLSKVGISSSQPAINSIPNFLTQDSSSNTSSCNSSTPSSPALIIPHSPVHKSSFTYADPTIRKIHQQSDIPVDMRPWVNYEPKPPPPPISTSMHSNVIDSRQSHDSDRTVSTTSGSGSTGTDDSERTVAGRVDSQDSTVSEGETNDSRCTRQNSVSSVSQSLREWDIPYDDLVHGEIIGKGRFGTVYSGNWHGQVAIKEASHGLC